MFSNPCLQLPLGELSTLCSFFKTAEGDQIRSVELQEQIAQMLAPAALPPP